MTGDGYGISASEASGSGNLYSPASSVGSVMNNQSLNAISMQSMPKTNSPLMINSQSNIHSTQQAATMKSQSIDQLEKMNFQPQYSGRENFTQPHEQQQFQQPSHQFQRQQLLQNQVQQRQTQNQLLLKNDTSGQSQLSSNMLAEAKSGHGIEHGDEGMQSQVSDPFQFSDMQSQFQHNSMDDHSRATQLLSHPSGPQDVSSTVTHTSDQIQQQFGNQQSDFGGVPGGIQPDAGLHGQWYSKSQDVSHLSGRVAQDPSVQNEFQHRLTGQDVAQLNNLSSKESSLGQSDASRSAEPPSKSNDVSRSNNLNRERQYKNQQRWILFLRHARRCPAPEGKCPESTCSNAQKLLKHMEHCNVFQCPYPRCCDTRVLINHHRRCRETSCPVCIPVRNYVQQAQLKALARSDFNSGLPNSINSSCKSYEAAEIAGRSMHKTSPMVVETPQDLQPSIKRMKIEHGSQSMVSESETSVPLASTVNESPVRDAVHPEQHHNSQMSMKSEITQVKVEVPGSVGPLCSNFIEKKKEKMEDFYTQRPEGDHSASNNPVGFSSVHEVVKSEKEMVQAKVENPPLPSESTSKSGKPNIKGVSMTELFTPEQVRQHISGLRQWVGQVSLVLIFAVYFTRPAVTFLF